MSTPPRWTDDMIAEARRLYAQGMKTVDIGKVFNVTRKRMNWVLNHHKGKSNRNETAWTPERVEEVRLAWADGKTSAAIGLEQGVTKNCIVSIARRHGFPKRPSPIRPRRLDSPIKPKTRAPRVTLSSIAGPAAGPHANPRPERQTPAARVVPHGQHWLPIKGPTLPPLALPKPQPVYAGRISECAHIISGELRHAIRCDKPTLPNKSLCSEHHAFCYQPDFRRGNPNGAASNLVSARMTAVHPGTFEEVAADAA